MEEDPANIRGLMGGEEDSYTSYKGQSSGFG